MRPFRSFKAHDRGITSLVTLATSITGGRELLATISEGLDAKIWDVHAMQCAATLRGHRERITCVTHAANIVFTGSTDRTIRKWVLNEDCACRAVLRGHTGSITSLAVDKAAVWLVSGAHDGAICVWHIPSSTCTTVFGGGKGVIYGETAVFPRCLILEESRSYLYCGLHNGEVQLWDLHKHMVPVKRPTVVNRTKPRLLLPGKPDEIVATAREMVNISRSKLNPLSSSIFDAWDGVSLSTQDVMLPGCTYEYSLKVKNFGPPLKSVVVKDMLETGMEYLECRPVAAAVRITHTFNGRPVLHWHLAALGVAKEATLTVRVKAQSQGKFARPVQLVKPAGLAVMRMKMINGDLHCGFQGGNVLRLKLKYDGSCVPMRTMFKQLPLDDDPWTNKQVRKRGFCHLTVRLCVATCRRMCRPCASKEVAPIGKPPIAQVIDTHTLNQMTDQVGDLEQSILVTGLDGDSTWTSFCVGKEVHAIRGKDVHTTNYHPISVRAMDVSTGSMAIGYSDGVVRVWPMTLSRSWEDVDLFFVFIFNVGYFLLLLTYLPCLWRSSSVVYQLVVSYGCRSCKRPLVGTTRRRLILDGFICTVLDLWSALIFLLFVFLLPPRNDVKAAWKVKLTEFKPKPHIFSEEMVDAYWVRLSAHFARLDSIASRLSARLSTGSRRLQTFCREALYGGHRSHIVSIDAWGARVFTACKSGIICEWHLKDIDTIQVQWNGRAGTTCMRFMPVHDRLTTMWVGSDDGYLDVRNLLNSGEVICSFAGGQRGGATCMAMGRINEHSSMYIGWQDGSILKTQLTKPIGALLMREVEILAVLDGHVKSVVDVVVHNYIVYSRSQGRVLAHSMKSHECLVCFNDSDEDVVSDFCCWNEFMFVAHNHNVLVWNLSESLHRKDPMGLNDLNVEGAEGKMIAAKGGKLACVLEGHTALVTSLKLSKNSIFSGSGDGTIREWKLSHPWECVVVFDSQVDRVDRMAILHDQLYCSHPDGLVRGWKLGDAPTALTKGKEAKNLKKTTTETLDKLLRQAKASQRDLRDVTFGPHTGRCAEVLLDPPTAVTAIHAFESPPLDGRVYIGLQSGEIRVVEGVTGGQLAQMRCGHNSGGVGWLALEIFSTFTQLVQLVGLGFCIDNLLWSYSGASVRQSLGPLVFRARGFHAPAFKPVFLRAAILCALYVALVVCQVEYNLVGNLVLRCKYSVRMYMQHLLTFISATSWYLVWLGSTVLVIPATRGLATVFDCKRNCWQGEHAVYAGISAALLLLYVPLAARLSCVHGDVLRLAHGRWATWRLDAYRDDAVGFVPTFCVRAERTWVFPFATFMKVAAALLSTVTQIPSLCAFWLCLISLIMVAVALFAAPFRSRNGNLIVLGGFLVFGASSTAAFASSWFQDWQYDRPAVVFLATCFPILIGPAALLNLSTIGHAARYTCSAMVRALSCLSLAAYSRRRRKKELQAKVKMAIGGSSVLLKLLGTSQETQAAAAPKMTLLQRMQAAQATVEGSSTDVSTTTAPGRPSLASAAPGRLRNGAPPLPSGSHTHSMDGGAPAGGGDKRMRWKKVSLATKLGGISGRDDATVAKALHTRRSCWGKVKYCATRDAWRACLVTCWKYRNPQEIADAVKRLGRKLKVRARWVKDSVLHPDKLRACCKAKAAAMKTPISKCWQRCTLCAKEPGRLVHSCCRFAKGYCVFIGSTIAAWFVQLRCSRWVVRKLPQRALCPNCRSCCRRVFRSLCRGHVDRVVGIDDSLGAHGGDRFLVFWEECEAQEREEAKEREEAVARRDKQAQYEAQMKLAREENLRRREEESGARDAAFDPTLPDARADDGSQVVTQEPEPETASTPPEMLTPRSGDIAPDPEPVRDKEPRRRAFKW
jgi:WD40 repeat protein